MQIKIDSIVYPGRSLARDSGKVIFTDEGLPGELVEVETIKEKDNFTQAKTTRIAEPSSHRVTPRCDHYKTCSSYQYIDYPQQIEIKRTQIKELFQRGLRVDLEKVDLKFPSRIWEYRNRIRFHVLWDINNVNFAYHMPDSFDEFVKINRCYLASRQINILLAELRDVLAKVRMPTLIEIEVKENQKGEMLLVLFAKNDSELSIIIETLTPLEKKFNLIGAVVILQEGKSIEKNIFGKNQIVDVAADCEFLIGPLSFFQVNREMLEVLLQDIKELCIQTQKTRVIDFYSGVGTFGLTLAKTVKDLVCVESMQENIDYLKQNIVRNNAANVTFLHSDSLQWLMKEKTTENDFLIVDPPRKGLGDEMCEAILNSHARLLCYISCNPSTFIRDLKKLTPTFQIKKVTGYDFFPHTPHIEIAALLEK